jgi:hypothetical protein
MLTDSKWLRPEPMTGTYEHGNEPYGSKKTGGIISPAERLSTSQEKLHSKYLA